MRRVAVCITACFLWAAPGSATSLPASEYPDKPAGLEKLARDVLKAQSHGDEAQTTALINGALLPDALAWYSKVFDDTTARALARTYETERANFPRLLAEFFSHAQRDHFTEPQAQRFESSCDDNSGEETFGVLFAREVPVPLYDLRLYNGRMLRRLWAWAYVDGAFRFVATLRPPQKFVWTSAGTVPGKDAGRSEAVKRVQVATGVQEARLIKRVTPIYPGVAVSEHLEGTVRIGVIIGTDGTLRGMRVISGYCSLAESAVAAVRRWRYQPTLLEGKPIEAQTTIDVTFQLNR